MNIGVGALATLKRPANVALRPLMAHYTSLKADSWGFSGPPRTAMASALLPMGGAVSGVAGPNWMLVGDAAACVNPMNGEGHRLRPGNRAPGRLDAGAPRVGPGLAGTAAIALRTDSRWPAASGSC